VRFHDDPFPKVFVKLFQHGYKNWRRYIKTTVNVLRIHVAYALKQLKRFHGTIISFYVLGHSVWYMPFVAQTIIALDNFIYIARNSNIRITPASLVMFRLSIYDFLPDIRIYL
jgi:hypothetical protein